MEFTEYTTVQGDRLDLIAFKVYGNPHLWSGIIESNPELPILPEYEGGIEISIPIIAATDSGIGETINLPPWKQ